jgi:UDP-glucose 4-epimerase
MRAVVTGGAGFIGSHLVDRLVNEGDEVLVIDDLSSGHLDNLKSAREFGSVKVHTMDILDRDLGVVLGRFRPDTVFHLAAQASVSVSMADPMYDAQVNVLGTISVLEACRRSGAGRIVFASSGGALAGPGSAIPTKETQKPRPISPYGVAKLAASEYLAMYQRTYGLDHVVIAPANVYGPRQRAHAEGGVVAIFVETLLAGRPGTIFGGGGQTRDFVFVADVADAFFRASRTTNVGRTYHIGTGTETSISDLYGLIAKATGGPATPIFEAAKPGDIERSALDASAAVRGLDWAPWTAVVEGVAETVRSYR